MIDRNDIKEEELYFSIYCITALACNFNREPSEIYKLVTEDTKILDEYIIRYYDILHTQSEDYIVDDIVKLLQSKGIQL